VQKQTIDDAFGAILYAVAPGDSMVSALTNIIGRALNTHV
jgi:Protein of unknown function (DUF4244)